MGAHLETLPAFPTLAMEARTAAWHGAVWEMHPQDSSGALSSPALVALTGVSMAGAAGVAGAWTWTCACRRRLGVGGGGAAGAARPGLSRILALRQLQETLWSLLLECPYCHFLGKKTEDVVCLSLKSSKRKP